MDERYGTVARCGVLVTVGLLTLLGYRPSMVAVANCWHARGCRGRSDHRQSRSQDRRSVMQTSHRLALISIAVPMLTLSAATAIAAPTNAPTALNGTADCGSDGTFTFVVNSGRANANTWSPAFVIRSDGRTARFIPASLDLTFSSPEGTDTTSQAKHSAPGPVSCEISATPFPGASLTGTVTGKLVWTG